MPEMASAGAFLRRPCESVVVALSGRRRRRSLQWCIEQALTDNICPTYFRTPVCEWLDTQDLPDASEATLSLVVTRIAAVLNQIAKQVPSERQPAYRVVLHEYARNEAVCVVKANPTVSRQQSLRAVLRTVAAMYADEQGCSVEEGAYVSLAPAGTVPRMHIPGYELGKEPAAGALVAIMAAYLAVLSVTTGRKTVTADVCVPNRAGGWGDALKHCDVALSSGMALGELCERVHEQLYEPRDGRGALIRSSAGLVVAPLGSAAQAVRCGALRMSCQPGTHLGDWETAVTLAPDNEPRISIECAFAPATMAQLLGHAIQRVVTRPETTIAHLTAH